MNKAKDIYVDPSNAKMGWPEFWRIIQRKLKSQGYKRSTLMVYRQVLRNVARYTHARPGEISRSQLRAYLRSQAGQRKSASWIAMNISILRTCFDKMCGMELLHNTPGPRRNYSLSYILTSNELKQLLNASGCPRNTLIVMLLYGCGLKPGELTELKWGDFDLDANSLKIRGARERRVVIPMSIREVLNEGQKTCHADQFIFTGRSGQKAIALRTVNRIIQDIAAMAGISKPVTAMTLRYTYAVHQLQAGINIREVQENLGLTTIDALVHLAIHYARRQPGDQPTVEPEKAMPQLKTAGLWSFVKPVDAVRYFRQWMKSYIWGGFQTARSSG